MTQTTTVRTAAFFPEGLSLGCGWRVRVSPNDHGRRRLTIWRPAADGKARKEVVLPTEFEVGGIPSAEQYEDMIASALLALAEAEHGLRSWDYPAQTHDWLCEHGYDGEALAALRAVMAR